LDEILRQSLRLRVKVLFTILDLRRNVVVRLDVTFLYLT